MNVIITVTGSVRVLPAPGVTAGPYRFTLTAASGVTPLHQDTNSPTATFPDVPPGDYTASVLRLGSDGIAFADPISAPVTVPDPNAEMVDVPASITVSLA